MTEYDLHHHGDQDVAAGLVDLAVNVRVRWPPPWLRAELAGCLDGLAAYPDVRAATDAVAARLVALRDDPAEVERVRDAVRRGREHHSWEARARQVAEDLSALR